MDYPNYSSSFSEPFVQQSQDPNRVRDTANQDTHLKQSEMKKFMSDTLNGDKETYHRLLDLVELLSGVEVDSRHLQQLRQPFINHESQQIVARLPADGFKTQLVSNVF